MPSSAVMLCTCRHSDPVYKLYPFTLLLLCTVLHKPNAELGTGWLNRLATLAPCPLSPCSSALFHLFHLILLLFFTGWDADKPATTHTEDVSSFHWLAALNRDLILTVAPNISNTHQRARSKEVKMSSEKHIMVKSCTAAKSNQTTLWYLLRS